jgi:hypothetical protein
MCDRTEAHCIFLQFQAHVERLLNTKIKCAQSDWGGEYQKIHNTFRSLGIAHRVSYPYTHQQNGSVERKHRHIVETGLALLAHASMPIKFWDEAFLTATYLINRLPTRVIDNMCPLERLFNSPPNYSLLRVFGCSCWPNLRPYNKIKLSFRSKECVFLGYSSLHKGYKCLDPDSGRVYISRDVTFDENIFPFSKLTSQPSSPDTSSPMTELRALQLPASSVNLNCNHMHIVVPANPLTVEDSVPPASSLGLPIAALAPESTLEQRLCHQRNNLPRAQSLLMTCIYSSLGCLTLLGSRNLLVLPCWLISPCLRQGPRPGNVQHQHLHQILSQHQVNHRFIT